MRGLRGDTKQAGLGWIRAMSGLAAVLFIVRIEVAAQRLPENPIEADAQSVATGKQLYQRQCAICHGSEGRGNGPMARRLDGAPPSNLADARWDHGSTDGEIFRSIREGIGPAFSMRAYKDRINEEETWHVVNFIRSLGGAS